MPRPAGDALLLAEPDLRCILAEKGPIFAPGAVYRRIGSALVSSVFGSEHTGKGKRKARPSFCVNGLVSAIVETN